MSVETLCLKQTHPSSIPTIDPRSMSDNAWFRQLRASFVRKCVQSQPLDFANSVSSCDRRKYSSGGFGSMFAFTEHWETVFAYDGAFRLIDVSLRSVAPMWVPSGQVGLQYSSRIA